MKNKNYTATEVETKLAAIGIRVNERRVLVPQRTHIGIKRWGMIDYLLHHAGCTGWIRVIQ